MITTIKDIKVGDRISLLDVCNPAVLTVKKKRLTCTGENRFPMLKSTTLIWINDWYYAMEFTTDEYPKPWSHGFTEDLEVYKHEN